MRSIVPLLALLAGCSPQGAERREAAPSEAAAPAASTSASSDAASEPGPAAQGRRHVYSSLENCRTIREEREEMPLTEVECPGAGAFGVRILDADARQAMTLVDPGGTPHRLDTARIGGGGFSAFGKTAEWRGDDRSAAGGHFEPDSLIVRYNVAEKPHPAPETPYLLVVRLGRVPCIVTAVPPGPTQNDSARAAADRAGPCPAG